MKNRNPVIFKFISIALFIALLSFFIITPVISVNASDRKSSEGEKDFFEISDKAGLENFIKKSRKDPGINGRLTKDIVLNDPEAFESQKNLRSFESIYGGTPEEKTAYTGEFDGQGHTITGYVSCENLPLFNIIDRSAYVHDLKIDYSVFSPTHNKTALDVTEYCASMAQVNYGHIKNIDISGSVTGRGLCAGIAGVNESSGVIEGCSFKGRVIGGIGIKTVSDPKMKYAYEFVVINNGVIKDCESDAEIKSVAGLSIPYTLDGYPADEGSEKTADTGSEKKDDAASRQTSGSDSKKDTSKKDTSGNSSKDKTPSDKGSASENSADAEDDYIGPDKDLVVKLVKGDTLWALARVYYGAGIKYKHMQLKDRSGKFGGLEGHVLTRLQIGTEVFIPKLDPDD